MSDLAEVECFVCGVSIYLTTTYIGNRKSDRATFHCPNGHSNHFPGEKDADKAARLERVTKDQARSIDNLLAERELLNKKVKAFIAEKRAAKKAAAEAP